MPIDPSRAGAAALPYRASWTRDDCLLYAVAVGAGVDELAFTTETTEGVPQQVLPTFALVIGASLERMPYVGTYDLANLVHAEQRLTLHRPLPLEGEVELRPRVAGIYDKGTAAIVATKCEAVLVADDRPLFTTYSSSFIRGEGGWGGERGPSGSLNAIPERPADLELTDETSPDQALVYRLTGDRNRLHTDPAFAARGGFPRPILHGLCTYGFAARALLHGLCGSDPARFHHVEARFTAPVLPGAALTTQMWRTAPGAAVFRTVTSDGTMVIDSGGVRFSEP